MDLNAYHRAWMNGATEAEAVRAGEDAWEEMRYADADERKASKHLEQLIYENEQRMIEANIQAESEVQL